MNVGAASRAEEDRAHKIAVQQHLLRQDRDVPRATRHDVDIDALADMASTLVEGGLILGRALNGGNA